MSPGLSLVSGNDNVHVHLADSVLDLKEWLDTHGIPAPQPTTRDKLIASVRRNARTASLKMSDTAASASKSAADAAQTLSDKLLDSWSDSREDIILTSPIEH